MAARGGRRKRRRGAPPEPPAAPAARADQDAGGAIAIAGGSVSLTLVTVSSNSVAGGAGGNGAYGLFPGDGGDGFAGGSGGKGGDGASPSGPGSNGGGGGPNGKGPSTAGPREHQVEACVCRYPVVRMVHARRRPRRASRVVAVGTAAGRPFRLVNQSTTNHPRQDGSVDEETRQHVSLLSRLLRSQTRPKPEVIVR